MAIAGDVTHDVATETVTNYIWVHAFDAIDRCDAMALSAALPVSFDIYKFDTWPAFVVDLLPQGAGRRELVAKLNLPRDTRAADWVLLTHGAGNPIGNLRVAEAANYLIQNAVPSRGFTYAEIVAKSDTFKESLIAQGVSFTGSDSVQGEWPKLLLTQDKNGLWHLDHLLADNDAGKHWVVKFPHQAYELRNFLALESAYMHIANDIGLRTGEPTLHDNGVLFIPRFDRISSATGVTRIGQESLYSLAGRSGFDINLSHNQACAVIAKYCTDPVADITEYVLRDVTNIVMGNKDNHGRNTAFQRFADGRVTLSPLYDFAPMFLHPEGITRRMRWEQDDGGAPDWRSVAEQAAEAGNIDITMLRQRLAKFADKIAQLPEIMAQHDVPHNIIEQLRLGIDANVKALRLIG